MPTDLFQRQEDFYELRNRFRASALTALRKRESLPLPVDKDGNELLAKFDDQGHAHYYNQAGEKVDRVLWQGTGKDGKPGGMAVGTRKGLDLDSAQQHWGTPAISNFEILEVAEDGSHIGQELVDLNRDAATMERAERVSHGAAGEQAPQFHLSRPGDDATVDAELQAYIARKTALREGEER
jgi:hypothetical protein